MSSVNWEYQVKTIYYSSGYPDTLRYGLNTEGQNGWELIAILKNGQDSVEAIFKKPYYYISDTGPR